MKTNLLLKKASLAIAMLATVSAAHAFTSNWKEAADGVTFPDPATSNFKNPAAVDLDSLSRVDTGMSKAQVVTLIGRPHFTDDSMFINRRWNYVFRFKQADDSYKVCQYQVNFGYKSNLVENMYTTCATPAPAAPVAQKMPSMTTLSADALFAFGRSGLKDVSPQGMSEIRNLANRLTQAYSRVDSIAVTGHTDMIGSNASNMALSRARANTVKQILVSQGVSSSIVTTEGKGSSMPVANCSKNQPRAALIACLAPNRRVTLQVSGQDRS